MGSPACAVRPFQSPTFHGRASCYPPAGTAQLQPGAHLTRPEWAGIGALLRSGIIHRGRVLFERPGLTGILLGACKDPAGMVSSWARKFQEVLIKDNIPAEAITLIK